MEDIIFGIIVILVTISSVINLVQFCAKLIKNTAQKRQAKKVKKCLDFLSKYGKEQEG